MTEPYAAYDFDFASAAARVSVTDAFAARGVVRAVGDDVATVVGLDDVGYEELVGFDSGALGMASELGATSTGVVMLSRGARVSIGEGARSLGVPPSIVAGAELLGRLVDPLGVPVDGGPAIASGARRALFSSAPMLVERTAVARPLRTGITVVDAAIPIGRGQRELVIGDRDVGKTALAIDAIAAQRVGDVRCVYVAIGQPMSRILATRETLLRAGCLSNVAIVAADASVPAGMRYLAPYAGAAVAETFRQEGGDVLIVFDDLTKHADAFRELTLLLGRPSGREAFPGDVFYVHAELLERAAAFAPSAGGGSITALPLVETTDGDISAYIPTNLISITDGQIYLDSTRFERNERPAVDVGRSVSRIGSAAQPAALRAVARNLRILMSRFESLEALSRVGLEVEDQTRRVLARGRIMRELLRQSRLSPRSLARQVTELLSVSEGWLDGCSPEHARGAIERAWSRAEQQHAELLASFDEARPPSADWRNAIEALVRAAVSEAPP